MGSAISFYQNRTKNKYNNLTSRLLLELKLKSQMTMYIQYILKIKIRKHYRKPTTKNFFSSQIDMTGFGSAISLY